MKTKLTYDGYPVLTERQIRQIAENMIPQKLRPYYVGADIMKMSVFEDYSAWNSDIELRFRYPVTGEIDGARYAHSDLEGMERELAYMGIDEDSKTDEYSEYDEWADAKPIKRIVPLRKPIKWRVVK